MNKIGIHYGYMTKEWITDFNRCISKASELGFDVLEISVSRFLDISKFDREKIKKFAEEKNIAFSFNFGLSKEYDISSENDSIRKNGIAYLKKILELVSSMGGTSFSGVNYAAWGASLTKDESKKFYIERSINSMKEVIKEAEDLGINYSIEVLNRFEQFIINTCDEAIDFINRVDSPNLKIHLDTFHMNIEEKNIKDAIIKAGNRLGHVHICENNRNLPGNGHIPWDEVFGAIRRINYRGFIVIESFVQSGDEIGNALNVWRNLIEKENLDLELSKSLAFVKNKLSAS